MAVSYWSARGQDSPKIELFAGYSYQRCAPLTGAVSLNGWQAEVKIKLTPRVGLVSNAGGNYGQTPVFYGTFEQHWADAGPPFATLPMVRLGRADEGVRRHSFLFGPEVRLMRVSRVAVSARSLAGVAHGAQVTTTAIFVRSTADGLDLPAFTGFAAAFGGNAEVRLSGRLAYRLLQPELFLTRLGSRTQRDFRVSTGLVFLFGN